MTTSYIQAITERHFKQLSLASSYHLAFKAAHISKKNDDAFHVLRSVTLLLLADIDSRGAAQAAIEKEPDYHSRQHIADAVLSMGFFLRDSNLSDYEKQLLLLVMLVHDFGHRGIANKLPDLAHEDESIELLKTTPLMSLPAEDIDFVYQCIVGTKPENVSKVAGQFANTPGDSFAFMRALVNDADIAASFVEPLGEELSKLILLEKGALNPSEKQIHEALSAFKQHAQIATPVARKLLGLDLED